MTNAQSKQSNSDNCYTEYNTSRVFKELGICDDIQSIIVGYKENMEKTEQLDRIQIIKDEKIDWINENKTTQVDMIDSQNMGVDVYMNTHIEACLMNYITDMKLDYNINFNINEIIIKIDAKKNTTTIKGIKVESYYHEQYEQDMNRLIAFAYKKSYTALKRMIQD